MSLFSCILIFILTVVSQEVFANSKDWVAHARRLSGESDAVRNRSIAALKKIPRLEKKLREELKRYQPEATRLQSEVFLALDVISTLKITALIPDLTILADRDTSGYSIHALNSLITKKNLTKTIGFYHQLFHSSKSSPAAKIAILDTFSRMQVKIDFKHLRGLFEISSPQVQGAILNYVRIYTQSPEFKDYLPILKLALETGGYQIRMQTLYLVSEVGSQVKPIAWTVLESCKEDSHPKVQKFCQSLRGA